MKKEELEKYIEEGISLNQISKLTLKSLTTIRYWVNKYELKSSFVTFKDQVKTEYGETRFCPRCKKDVETKKFHQRR